jgi:hypothetical protein
MYYVIQAVFYDGGYLFGKVSEMAALNSPPPTHHFGQLRVCYEQLVGSVRLRHDVSSSSQQVVKNAGRLFWGGGGADFEGCTAPLSDATEIGQEM